MTDSGVADCLGHGADDGFNPLMPTETVGYHLQHVAGAAQGACQLGIERLKSRDGVIGLRCLGANLSEGLCSAGKLKIVACRGVAGVSSVDIVISC